MTLYRDEGVVLRTYRLGEADRIVVLLTRGRGKVRAVAKGIRKTKSKFGARLEPGGHANLLMYEGRELDIINQAETVDHYRALREDLERMTDVMAMLEAVDQVAQEGEPNAPLFRMLTSALRTLGEADQRPVLLVAAFYWKLLALEGVSPVLEECVMCASEGTRTTGDELVAFDFVEGGALCRRHRRGPAIDPDALSLIRRILGGGLAGVLGEPASPAAAAVSGLATTALEAHLERRLRAVHLLGH
ncbi:MAG TPA: DNA repair protein RecO [Acidimicrobiales bacterium]|nr:DNA repair protein RecO [Acidimicrobiales bacterium]